MQTNPRFFLSLRNSNSDKTIFLVGTDLNQVDEKVACDSIDSILVAEGETDLRLTCCLSFLYHRRWKRGDRRNSLREKRRFCIATRQRGIGFQALQGWLQMCERGLDRHHWEGGVLLQARQRGGGVQVCQRRFCLLEGGVSLQAWDKRIKTYKRGTWTCHRDSFRDDCRLQVGEGDEPKEIFFERGAGDREEERLSECDLGLPRSPSRLCPRHRLSWSHLLVKSRPLIQTTQESVCYLNHKLFKYISFWCDWAHRRKTLKD